MNAEIGSIARGGTEQPAHTQDDCARAAGPEKTLGLPRSQSHCAFQLSAAGDERGGEGRNVLASGLPLFHGAQLAVDITLRSALACNGEPRPGAARVNGSVCERARADKETKYAQLLAGDRCRLVMALETGDRWSSEAVPARRKPGQFTSTGGTTRTGEASVPGLEATMDACDLHLVCTSIRHFFFGDRRMKKVSSHPPRQAHLRTCPPSSLRVSRARSLCEGLVGAPGVTRRKPLTTLHANIELHRRNHAALALSWRIMGTASTRAFANPRKNWAVSSDHLPPTSAAKTTRRALPSVPRGEFRVSGFLPAPGRLQSGPVVVCRSWSGRKISSQRGTQMSCLWQVAHPATRSDRPQSPPPVDGRMR